MMILVAPLAVALVAFILYAIDRKSKGEPIAWESALKLMGFSGIITSGVVYAASSESLLEVVKSVELPTAVQDMFVGIPTF